MTDDDDDDRRRDRRIALAREWEELVARVRTLDGFERFLEPAPIEQLVAVGEAGPVVVLNVSRWRCDALLIAGDGVRAIELADLSADDLVEQTTRYLDALYGLHSIESFGRLEPTLAEILAWLWDVVAEPVLAALGLTGAPAGGATTPRLWWCPTGLLTLLPLHAAGHHSATGREAAAAVMDRVVSSYTPTVRALAEARARRTEAADGRMLFVAPGDVPGEDGLASVPRERAALVERFAAACTMLEGPQASRAAVRRELPRHAWAHFSCHADQDLANPSLGGLKLHDGTLTAGDLGEGRHRGEFAFLSACKTAVGGVALRDEAITLAAALQYTGYRHVIGTLWSVYDDDAAEVAERVYAGLFAGGRFAPQRAAHALHDAIAQLRAGGLPLSAWTPFTHTGP